MSHDFWTQFDNSARSEVSNAQIKWKTDLFPVKMYDHVRTYWMTMNAIALY